DEAATYFPPENKSGGSNAGGDVGTDDRAAALQIDQTDAALGEAAGEIRAGIRCQNDDVAANVASRAFVGDGADELPGIQTGPGEIACTAGRNSLADVGVHDVAGGD